MRRVLMALGALVAIAMVVIGIHPPADLNATQTTNHLALDDPAVSGRAEIPPTGAAADSGSMDDGARVTPAAETAAGVDLRPGADGFLVVAGSGEATGAQAAPLIRYTVEVQPELQRYAESLLDVSDRVLHDTERGWTSQGERRLKRIDDPAKADIRVVLATPGTVDQYCLAAGLDTGGQVSCWDGQRTMLNLRRWLTATDSFKSVNRYRSYLVNHEFGHGLGYQHEYCPGPGLLAPVMMQQTLSVGECRPNGYPHP